MTRKEILKKLKECGVLVDRADLENEELLDLLIMVKENTEEETQSFCKTETPKHDCSCCSPAHDCDEDIILPKPSKEDTNNNILTDEDLSINKHLGVEEEISEFSKQGSTCFVKNIFRNIHELIGEEREHFAIFFFKMGQKYPEYTIHYFENLETYTIFKGNIEEAEILTKELLEEFFK